MEPIYLFDIQCVEQSIGSVYNCLTMRRGCVIESSHKYGSPVYNIKGYLPVKWKNKINSYIF